MTAVILRLAGVVVLLLAVRLLLLLRNGRHHPIQQVAGDGHCQPHSGLHHHGQGHLGHPSGHVFTVAVAIYLTRMGEGRDGKGGKSESPHLIVRYIRPSIKHKIIDTPYIAILYNCFIS